MTTIQVLDRNPIPTGAAAAVTQVQQTMQSLKQTQDQFMAKLDAATSNILDASQPENTEFAAPDLNFQPAPISLVPQQLADLSDASTISDDVPTASIAVNIPAQPTFDWPTAPLLDPVNVPPAPVSQVGQAPARPPVNTDIALPASPTLSFPDAPSLTEMVIPPFVAPVLPTWGDVVAPTFDAVSPNVRPNFAEPVYDSESFPEILATLKSWRAGESGLPAAYEQAIFERGKQREERQLSKTVADIYDQYAARGFNAIPGVLAAQLRDASETAALTVISLSRDVYVKATDTQMENLRLSVQQGLAAEQILVNIFSNAAQRAFDMARIEVEGAMTLYNAQVSIFNALTSAFQTKAAVKKMQIDAELAKLETYRLQLEGEKLKGDINQQRVQLFDTLLKATLSRIEVYKAQLQSVQSQVDIVRALFDAYKTDVSAFGETVNAEKLKFDAHKSLVDAAVAQGQINQQRVGIFSTLVQAEQARGQVWQQAAQVEVARVGAEAQIFGSRMEGFRALTAAQLGRVQATADLQRVAVASSDSYNRGVIANAEAQIRIGQQRLDSNIQKAQLGVKLYEVNITNINQRKQIQMQAFQAVAQYAATLAGGAMAAQHVSAAISSQANDSYTVQKSEQISNQLQEKV